MNALNENQKTHPAAEVLSDLSRLKEYTRAKQTVASEVRNLSAFLKGSVGEREAEACRQLMAQLADDRFSLAVLGQFERGKSSLMNAMIGRDLLPTGGVLPTAHLGHHSPEIWSQGATHDREGGSHVPGGSSRFQPC
ncbi:MAG: hypothetical protein GX422_09765 [Deltaproteobacteria bacterium]|nr:hypothetical protein [Deltaproteobacteria bacterium]